MTEEKKEWAPSDILASKKAEALKLLLETKVEMVVLSFDSREDWDEWSLEAKPAKAGTALMSDGPKRRTFYSVVRDALIRTLNERVPLWSGDEGAYGQVVMEANGEVLITLNRVTTVEEQIRA